jgi:hypothetical protein
MCLLHQSLIIYIGWLDALTVTASVVGLHGWTFKKKCLKSS